MKLRMYLRGFGLGIIMTALVMSFGVKTDNSTMTDAQVRQRALELGMVDESTTLTTPQAVKEEPVDDQPVVEDISEEPVDNQPAVEEPSEEQETTDSAESIDNETESVQEDVSAEEDTDEGTEEVTKTEEATDEPAQDEVEEDSQETEIDASEEPKQESALKDYTLTIQKGYSSDRVAKILEDAGVIDSASSFDKYLCSNRYDNKISVGTYKIPMGADYSVIAKIITRTN